jgi:hypothetical protein
MKHLKLFEEYYSFEMEWEDCEGSKYFDKKSLHNYLSFKHPIYNIIEKRTLQDLVYMSPDEYIDEISSSFAISKQETLTGQYNEELVKKYANEMKNGSKFPVGYYTTNKPLQEGRHRYMACDFLDIQCVPVIKQTLELSNQYIEEYVREYMDLSKEELSELYKDYVPNGISTLDYDSIQNYAKYRLD